MSNSLQMITGMRGLLSYMSTWSWAFSLRVDVFLAGEVL